MASALACWSIELNPEARFSSHIAIRCPAQPGYGLFPDARHSSPRDCRRCNVLFAAQPLGLDAPDVPVHTRGDPRALATQVHDVLARTDPELAVIESSTVSALIQLATG